MESNPLLAFDVTFSQIKIELKRFLYNTYFTIITNKIGLI